MAIWRDFDINMTRLPNGDLKAMENFDAINNSLSNIFQTFQGERRMLPDFALPIYQLLFEPIDRITANKLGNLILSAIDKWETRIVVEGLDVDARPDDNQYVCTLNYSIAGASEDELQTFETILRAR